MLTTYIFYKIRPLPLEWKILDESLAMYETCRWHCNQRFNETLPRQIYFSYRNDNLCLLQMKERNNTKHEIIQQEKKKE